MLHISKGKPSKTDHNNGREKGGGERRRKAEKVSIATSVFLIKP